LLLFGLITFSESFFLEQKPELNQNQTEKVKVRMPSQQRSRSKETKMQVTWFEQKKIETFTRFLQS